jgi:hypothetical protein
MSGWIVLLIAIAALIGGSVIYAVIDEIRQTLNDRKREAQRADAHVAKMRAQQDQDSSRRGTFNPTRSQ